MDEKNNDGFVDENEMQKYIFSETKDEVENQGERKEAAFLKGIPEINYDDEYKLYPIGREIKLLSGYLDNLYIDQDGVLTLVECKLFSNKEIKREVYSQILNYAADFKTMCNNSENEELLNLFNKILVNTQSEFKNHQTGVSDKMLPYYLYNAKISKDSKGEKIEKDNNSLSHFSALLNHIKKDNLNPIWADNFKRAFCQNLRSSAMRLIILCSPKENGEMSIYHIKNLMNIMSFGENSNNPYELILMRMDKKEASIIWRKYMQFPKLRFKAERNFQHQENVEKIKKEAVKLYDNNPLYKKLLEKIEKYGTGEDVLILQENTQGLAIKKKKNGKSLSTFVEIKLELNKNKKPRFYLNAHQIRDNGNKLYNNIDKIKALETKVNFIKLTQSNNLYNLHLIPTENNLDDIFTFIDDYSVFNRLD